MGNPQVLFRPNPTLQAPPNTVYVSFSAEIVPHTTESLIATVTNLTNQGVKQIYLMLSTPGGSVMHGMNIYNVLRALPVELITHNVGMWTRSEMPFSWLGQNVTPARTRRSCSMELGSTFRSKCESRKSFCESG